MMLQKGRPEILTERLLAVSRSLLATHSILRTKNRSVISKDGDRREAKATDERANPAILPTANDQ